MHFDVFFETNCVNAIRGKDKTILNDSSYFNLIF